MGTNLSLCLEKILEIDSLVTPPSTPIRPPPPTFTHFLWDSVLYFFFSFFFGRVKLNHQMITVSLGFWKDSLAPWKGVPILAVVGEL